MEYQHSVSFKIFFIKFYMCGIKSGFAGWSHIYTLKQLPIMIIITCTLTQEKATSTVKRATAS